MDYLWLFFYFYILFKILSLSICKYLINSLSVSDLLFEIRSKCNLNNVNVKKQEAFFRSLDFSCAFSLDDFFKLVSKILLLEKEVEKFKSDLSYSDASNIEINLIINLFALAFVRDAPICTSLSNILSFNKSIKIYYGLFTHTSKGAGGDESMFFLDEYGKAYSKIFSDFSLKKTKMGIYKIPNLEFKNACVLYSALLEGPIIRVQREPINSRGKIHTSTIVFLPVLLSLPEDSEEIVKHLMSPEMIEFDTFRSSGAGGQHVNKTESAVRAKHKVLDLVCISRDGRSQISNRQTALDRMTTKIRENLQETIGGAIHSHVLSADRSQKAQTFNYKRDQITYHSFSFSMPISTYFDNPINYYGKVWDKILNSCLGR